MKSSLVKQKHSLQVSRRADHTYNDILEGNVLFLIARNPELIVRCLLSFPVFFGVMARAGNIMYQWL